DSRCHIEFYGCCRTSRSSSRPNHALCGGSWPRACYGSIRLWLCHKRRLEGVCTFDCLGKIESPERWCADCLKEVVALSPALNSKPFLASSPRSIVTISHRDPKR